MSAGRPGAPASAAELLRATRATVDAVLESAAEGIVITDAAGRIRVTNRAAEAMFGYGREELVGRPLELLVPERLRDVHAGHRTAYFGAPRARPMGQGLELVARRKDGAEFPVEVSLSYLGTHEGVLAMAFVTDITERRQAEAALRRQRELLHQQEKLAALGTLAAGLAHEVNNPLGTIASRLELMLLEPEASDLPAQVREDLVVIQRQVARIAQIAHGLLSFARQAPRSREPVSLNRVVEETLLLVRRQLEGEGLSVEVSLDPALPAFPGDPGALQQVLLNLLTNAREAMDGAGSIAVTTRCAPGRTDALQLVVADSGPGIAPDVLPRIFDPFFTTKARGTGLGLSLSYGIVQDHEGAIEVRAEPGRGTTFVLTFPVR